MVSSAVRFYSRGNLIKGDLFVGLILLVVVALLLFGGLPLWPHSRNWGYGPSGGLGVALVVVVVLLLMGVLPHKF